jgi:hypothetical protein
MWEVFMRQVSSADVQKNFGEYRVAAEDLPEWLVEQIAASEMDAKYDHLDQNG